MTRFINNKKYLSITLKIKHTSEERSSQKKNIWQLLIIIKVCLTIVLKLIN